MLSAVPMGTICQTMTQPRRHRDPKTPTPAARHRGPGTRADRRARGGRRRPVPGPDRRPHPDPVRDRARRRHHRRLLDAARGVRASCLEAFQATDAGKDVQFETSFGASGDQSRAVAAGLLADYVAFSLETDMTRLVDAGIVAPDWNAGPNKGFVTDSVVTFVVRPGNPKGIKTWDDLIRPDVTRRHAQPVHLRRRPLEHPRRLRRQAAQGRQDRGRGRSPTSRSCSSTSWSRTRAAATRSTPSSRARATCSCPTRTRPSPRSSAQQPVDYVIPDDTILIQNPAAVTLNGDAVVPAKAFLDYVLSPEGQTIFGNLGYRPVDPAVLATFTQLPHAVQACSPSMTWVAGRRSPPSSSTRTPASSPRSTSAQP